MNYSSYQTPKISPKCVHYWDSVFQHSHFWFDWILLKSVVESFIPEIMQESKCSEKKAHRIIWAEYIEATCGDEESILWDISGDFVRLLSEYDMAYYLIHLSVGSDIEDGYTQEEGIQRYIEWLKESKGNGIYGKFKVTTDLEIIPVKRKSKGVKRKSKGK